LSPEFLLLEADGSLGSHLHLGQWRRWKHEPVELVATDFRYLGPFRRPPPGSKRVEWRPALADNEAPIEVDVHRELRLDPVMAGPAPQFVVTLIGAGQQRVDPNSGIVGVDVIRMKLTRLDRSRGIALASTSSFI